jgi:hypothetical protein
VWEGQAMSANGVVVAGKTIKTPECDKLLAVKDKSQVVGEFLDWLRDEKKVVLSIYSTAEDEERGRRHPEERLTPFYDNTEKMLAEFFEINLAKVERERRAILDALRESR